MTSWFLMQDLPSVTLDIIIKTIGPSPFENFSVGGDGMTGYSFYGREMIALRGYSSGNAESVLHH